MKRGALLDEALVAAAVLCGSFLMFSDYAEEGISGMGSSVWRSMEV